MGQLLDKEKEFLNELKDLLEKYKAGITVLGNQYRAGEQNITFVFVFYGFVNN